MQKILLTNYYSPKPLAFITSLLPDGFEFISLDKPGREEIIQKIPEADFLLVGGREKIDREVLDAAGKLRMIQRSGVGLDSLDLDAIRNKEIPLYVNEGVNAQSVAEHTILLILGTLRKIIIVDKKTRSGEWVKHDIGITCHELSGKQVGLVGLGSIGKCVARMLLAFGVRTVYYKPNRLSEDTEKFLGVEYRTFDNLLSTSDVISLHCGLSETTRSIIGRDEFDRMKKGAVLINTARGALIDDSAFIDALKSGHIAGAGLDVFSKEPLVSGHPFMDMDNVLLTPHMGSITQESFSRMMRTAISSIEQFHSGDLNSISKNRVL